MITKADAARELLRRREARRSLLSFIRYINPEYIVSDFSREVCAALEQFVIDCMNGERPVLILGAPPQHGKSEIVSRYLPAWMFGHNPDLRVAGLSYAKDLASDMNRDVQKIMLSPEYALLFPHSALNAKRVVTVETEAKRNSETFELLGRKGSYVGQGVGGPLTGKRVDCLVKGTMIQTNIGPICIEDVPIHADTCKILSFNGENLTYGRVKAFASSEGFGVYRITTQSGRFFESTGDHKVFTGRGWIEASKLANGDVLLCCLPKECDEDGGGLLKDVEVGRKRWQLLLNKMRRSSNPEVKAKKVRDLPKSFPGKGSQVLLKAVHAETDQKTPGHRKSVRYVHGQVFGSLDFWEIPGLLRSVMLRQGARSTHDGQGQPTLSGWEKPAKTAAAFSQSLSKREAVDSGKGWPFVRYLRKVWLSARGTSHGRMVKQQRIIEFGDSLRGLPQSSPQADGFRPIRDHVESVELVRESSTVYDIQVEGDHNFFANGVLVHNCGIIDDPIKNSKEALSSTVKESVWKWYGSTFLTRLSKNSGHIIMATRWATDDLSGRVIESNKRAKVLSFPAINANGEALIPDLHPVEKLLETKTILGDYFWSAMYQQSPVALGGNMFKAEWWQFYRVAPQIRWRGIYADTAQKTKDANDYSVLQLWGESIAGQAVLLDQLRGKWEAPDLLIQARAFWNKHRMAGVRSFNIEDKVSGTGLIQTLKREGVPVVAIQRNTDKITRAMDAAPFIQGGNVLLPEDAPWLSDYLSEFAAFPNGTNDDQCDPTMDAIKDILQGGAYSLSAWA